VPLPESTISATVEALRAHVQSRLQAGVGDDPTVLAGNPIDAVPDGAAARQTVNLFVHRFETWAHDPGVTPGRTLRLRLSCLVTAFGLNAEGVSAGQNDLRLLGEVIRIIHEEPTMTVAVDRPDGASETVRLDLVHVPLTIDELHNLWSTQGDVVCRPSILLDLGLAPVIPSTVDLEPPRVGRIGTAVTMPVNGRVGSAGPGGSVATYERRRMQPVTIDVLDLLWEPRIGLVLETDLEADLETGLEAGLETEGGRTLTDVIELELGSPELASFSPRVLVAGEPGAAVSLSFEVWSSSDGWQTIEHTVTVEPHGATIDPSSLPDPADLPEIPLPFRDRAGQAVLFAERTFTLPGTAAPRTVRSNLVLLTIVEGNGS